MLIRFMVENFLSFNEKVEISMVKGRSRSLKHHYIEAKSWNDLSLLKSAVIYGSNASGKSNLVKAMNFSKLFIVQGREINELIKVRKFKLDFENKKPTEFQYDFKVKDTIYSYGFSIKEENVIKEWLYESGKFTENLLFSRDTIKENTEVKLNWSKIRSLKENKISNDNINFLNYVAKGTRPNKLFLTESIEKNVEYFKDVYEWFHTNLTIIFPNEPMPWAEVVFSRFKGKRTDLFNKILKEFDLGIEEIGTNEINIQDTEIPKPFISDMEKKIKKNVVLLMTGPEGRRYAIFLDKNNELKTLKFYTKHKVKESKNEAIFDIYEESDGTQRLIDLIPVLINPEQVYVIDEIDRSLHPNITKHFLQLFLNEKFKDIKNQIIVTTHECLLLDLKDLRRDEIWFMEKNKHGESSMYSLEEYKPRYDKDIMRGYLKGRFGAIPFLGSTKQLNW